MQRTRSKRIMTDTPRTRREETSLRSHVASLAETVVKISVRCVAQGGPTPQRAAVCFMLTERDIATGVYSFLP